MTNTYPSFSDPAAPTQHGSPAPGYPQAPTYAPVQPYSAMAIAGFVLSLLSVSVVGLILSVLGLKDTNGGAKRGRGLAIAGIVLGALGVLWQVVLFIALFAGAAAGSGSGSFA